MAQLIAKKTSDGTKKALECEDSGEIRVVICGKTSLGVVTPIQVDAAGKVVTTV